ncbi:aminotransferase class I/II-fold pyridoxal phosphate-dependent enzyme [Lachnospiraceae bacterium OttesenSCG-928-E19]|nr:aminotransferase class I/II-fold pyridoxal phosphate-dependent enzyme [Lachnospiraceae bacterium OttesenSCG-928-E19]
MILFNSDYTEGAHPAIMEKLLETNMEQTVGYGEDPYCVEARELIRKACKNEGAEVHFMVGGTQTNTTIISSILRPYEGVLSAESGHINVHETGAIESTGHKVLSLSSKDGKIDAKQIETACKDHAADESFEHMVKPGMVYISHPTELGTLYTAEELEDIHQVCQKWDLPLFLDGARLGYGLCAPKTDVTLELIARFCDVFYIGGTKVGTLFGEAVIITNEILQKEFRYMIKQKGGMLAKGRLLGIQFAELFRDGLYYRMGQHGIDMAMLLKGEAVKKGYKLFMDSDTNQQFLIVKDSKLAELDQKYGTTYWGRVDESKSVIRICTSWATQEKNVRELIEDL